jgi:prepilin-type N-terminal cleavage/methylation domain-containing protein
MSSKGFTLIEILIVVLILSLVALGIIAMLPSGYNQVRKAGRLSVMNHLGQEKIDQLKAFGYNHADLIDGIHPSPDKTQYRLPATDLEDGYSLTWFVTPNQPAANVKAVTVEVGYMLYDQAGNPIAKNNNQLKQEFVAYIAQ